MVPGTELDHDKRRLTLSWPDGSIATHSYVWLRHAARCPGGFPNDTVNKLELVPDDPSGLAIREISASETGLSITWADGGLVTEHALGDLRNAIPGASPCKLWRAKNQNELPRFDYEELLNEEGYLALFLAVRDWGLAILQGVPPEDEKIGEVAKRFGPLNVSGYGRIFNVRSDKAKALGSNTAVFLGPHTDESYRHGPPGISFFHCIQSTPGAGGESLLVDGFAAARRLQESDPNAFDVLSDTPVNFRRMAPGSEDMRTSARIIALDSEGQIEGVRFTDRNIAPQSLPLDQIEGFYRAYKAFWREVNAPEARIEFALRPGEVNVFDNHRVLHGRNAFDPTMGPRHLQYCSVARDEFHSSLRVLAAGHDRDAAEAPMERGALR